jgi:hypothetical protein
MGMSGYWVTTQMLAEFGLITQEQADETDARLDRENDEAHAAYIKRRDAFEKEWKARTPWWERWFGPGWWHAWMKQERGT